MDKFMVESKDFLFDQTNTLRLVKGAKYEVRHEFPHGFLIVDESGNEVVFDKMNFYEVEED